MRPFENPNVQRYAQQREISISRIMGDDILLPCVSIIFFPGPVVQSTVSLTSSLRGQLVKCFTTL